MPSILAKLPIIKPKSVHAFVEAKEHGAYRFGDNLPESLFQARINVIKELVANEFPFTHPYFDYVLVTSFVIGLPFIFAYAYFSQSESHGNRDVPVYSFKIPAMFGFIIVPFVLYWIFSICLMFFVRSRILKFRYTLLAVLKNFTAEDMPRRNIKYLAKHYVPPRGVAHPDGQALIHFVIFVVLAGAEAEVDALPLYSSLNDDVVVLEAGPPDYEELEMQPVGRGNVAAAGVDDHLVRMLASPPIARPLADIPGGYTTSNLISSSTIPSAPLQADSLVLTISSGDGQEGAPLTIGRSEMNVTLPPAYSD